MLDTSGHQLGDGDQTDDEPAPPAGSVPEQYVSQLTPTEGVADEWSRKIISELDRRPTQSATVGQLEGVLECSRSTVSRALQGLRSDGIVRLRQLPSTNLFYLKHPQSEYPVPDDVTVADDRPTISDASLLDILLLRHKHATRAIISAAAILGIFLAVASAILQVLPFGEYTVATTALVMTALVNVTVSVAFVAVDRAADRVRE